MGGECVAAWTRLPLALLHSGSCAAPDKPRRPPAHLTHSNFNALLDESTSSQRFTMTSSAQLYLGGYTLNGGPAVMTLDRDFVANVKPLLNATDTAAMYNFVQSYGTHYGA